MFDKNEIVKRGTLVRCRIEEEANELLNWADSIGLTWCTGVKYTDKNNWQFSKDGVCYDFFNGESCSYEYCKKGNYNILEFKDVVIAEENLISMDKKYKTRDGKDVRVLCIDRKNINYPIIALVTDKHEELLLTYSSKGKSFIFDNINKNDLIEVKPIPDKALVRCLDNKEFFTYLKYEGFYDALNKCIFSLDGTRNGAEFDNYETINPEPKEIAEARKQLED